MTIPKPLDRVVRATPVGLRFWDGVTQTFVGVGLRITAYHPAYPTHRYKATTTRSNTYIIRGLPSLANYEFEEEDLNDWSPNRRYKLVVEVEDTLERFIPFTCVVRVPVGGYANLVCTPEGSPPNIISDGSIPLFSAPSRCVSSPVAVVYARLARLQTNAQTGREEIVPASWARVEILRGTNMLAHGIADENGSVALLFPYPAFSTVSTIGSPIPSEGTALPAQQWELQLRAFHTPETPIPRVPDLCRVLTEQAPLKLWRAHLTEELGSVTLRYGTELIVRSRDATMNDLSILVVST